MTQAGHGTDALFIPMATVSQGNLPSSASFPPAPSLQPHLAQHTMIPTSLIGQHPSPTPPGPAGPSIFPRAPSTAGTSVNSELPITSSGDGDIAQQGVVSSTVCVCVCACACGFVLVCELLLLSTPVGFMPLSCNVRRSYPVPDVPILVVSGLCVSALFVGRKGYTAGPSETPGTFCSRSFLSISPHS